MAKDIYYNSIMPYIEGDYTEEFTCEVYDENWNYLDIEYIDEKNVSENDKPESVLLYIRGIEGDSNTFRNEDLINIYRDGGAVIGFKLPYCLMRKSDNTLIRVEN